MEEHTWSVDTGGSIVFSILTEKFMREKNTWEAVTSSSPALLFATAVAAERAAHHRDWVSFTWSSSDIPEIEWVGKEEVAKSGVSAVYALRDGMNNQDNNRD